MRIIYIDYAELFYRDIVERDIPDFYSGKFVQIRHSRTEYFIFSPREFTKYHADIVERFCNDLNIGGIYDNVHKRFDILESVWVIVGGGKFEVDRKRKQVRLYDDSMAYGKFNMSGLEEKILLIDKFSGYEIRIE